MIWGRTGHRLALGLALGAACVGGCAAPDEDASGADDAALTSPGAAFTPGCAAAGEPGNPNFEFQDDDCKRKVFPSNADRDETCSVRYPSIPAGWETASAGAPKIDTTTFADIPQELDLTVIAIRRDASGIPHYRYFSNGTNARPFEPLSSTKFMAIANAASTLRARSNLTVGLEGSTDGIPLGDLVTIVHNYNEQHFESNALARWFENIGGRAKAGDLVHHWLGRPAEETFGGNYGAAAPALPYVIAMPNGASVAVTPDDPAAAPANHLSTQTMAEFLKRLVMHREDAATRLPGIQWLDLRVLFYGAAHAHWSLPSESGVVPPAGWGGMSADAAIYLQSAVDIHDVEKRAQGHWRIFSKLGYGASGFVENSYGCFPGLDNKGIELVISTHFAQPSDNPPVSRQRDAKIAAYYKQIVTRLRTLP